MTSYDIINDLRQDIEEKQLELEEKE